MILCQVAQQTPLSKEALQQAMTLLLRHCPEARMAQALGCLARLVALQPAPRTSGKDNASRLPKAVLETLTHTR